jgi:hypothetical protein
MLRRSGWLVVGTLLAAAAYELVLALRRTPSPAGSGVLLLVGVLAMLFAGGLVLARVPPIGLYAPAAALFVTARFYTGDPYYGAFFRRYADGGIFSPLWIFVLLASALVAGLTTHLFRRTRTVESTVVLALLLFTAFFMGTGH